VAEMRQDAREMGQNTRLCTYCGRSIALTSIGTDLSGRRVFVWHFDASGLRECAGSFGASYAPDMKERQ
jgi:hypothetical protein